MREKKRSKKKKELILTYATRHSLVLKEKKLNATPGATLTYTWRFGLRCAKKKTVGEKISKGVMANLQRDKKVTRKKQRDKKTRAKKKRHGTFDPPRFARLKNCKKKTESS